MIISIMLMLITIAIIAISMNLIMNIIIYNSY